MYEDSCLNTVIDQEYKLPKVHFWLKKQHINIPYLLAHPTLNLFCV